MQLDNNGGLSGYQVLISANDEIRKSSGLHDAERLRKQCIKQQSFRVRHPKFHVCEVICSGEIDGAFFFTMPYYRGDYAAHFVCRSSPRQLSALAHDLADFVDEMIADSTLRPVAREVVLSKSERTVLAVLRRLSTKRLQRLCEFHLEHVSTWPEFVLPIGKAHGDLTLSNVIFASGGHRYVLIDFLDAYLPSAILDMAKLRQETRLCWSSSVSDHVHDRTKYRIAMKHMDAILETRFAKYAFFQEYIDMFEFQNLLRVLPYTEDPSVIEVISLRLEGLCVKGSQA